MSDMDKLMRGVLLKLNSSEVREAFDLLEEVMNGLESKDDPEMFEIHFFNTAAQIMENISFLREILKEHTSGKLTGDRLQQLYDKRSTSVGSQVLFD
jgi:hypothetical protein